ncbi:hypothetical protein EDM59_21175 [Brevibacillus nitrificans]|uniref:Alpha/beta hydrolase n=1 Tax=Brevibacillus nitrificans TaxID=651560 RepID=A0A3M8D256_9BACL|nr:hypothetical protein EDM59_21175 [Brevibacillus nitrificans]
MPIDRKIWSYVTTVFLHFSIASSEDADKLAGESKELYIVPGAGHVALYAKMDTSRSTSSAVN